MVASTMSHGCDAPIDAARRLAAGALRDGFEFQALHAYTDLDAKPLYWRIRAKHPETGKKWIRPMTRTGKGYALREPEKPALGRPLYRLHELVLRPDDVVIVTEGESKADRLAALGLLATTSGSADSAADADWQALAGRDVLVWPDNDVPGRHYAEAVRAVLTLLGCEVKLIDVDLLMLAPKGDALDWLARHPEARAADVLALACEPDRCIGPRNDGATATMPDAAQTGTPARAADAVPNTCIHGAGRFELTERGVFFTGVDNEGNTKAPVWVCSPLGVIAKTRDSKSGSWGRLLEWFDDDNVRHQWAMPLELLEGDGTDVRRELARLGLHIATSRAARDLLAAYIKVWPVDQRARCVERLGWHGPVYTMASETIGEAGELVVFQNAHAVEPAFATAGTVEGWRDSVAALAAGNSRVVFAICTAFAGTLVGLVGEESGGFHLRGKSSCGKSTALKAAASVWGDPVTYGRAWRATANGLEGLASLHNDGLLILDELSQCDPKEAGEAAYLLANGQGKARAHRNGTARASLRWRLLFLSAGEESLAALMARTGRKANAGQEVRLADFDADAGVGLGAFETLNGCDSPAALSLALKDAATRHHGAAGLVWLRAVVNDRDKLADIITGGVRQFVAENTPQDAAGQVLRVAQRFGLVAVAGELATHYGVTGWAEGEATQAASRCFAAWLDSFGGSGNREDRILLAQVRGFFETHGASRFEDVGASIDQRVINRAGFYRSGMEGTREFLVLPEAFKRDLCAGFDQKAATQCLLAQGWILPGADGRPTQKPRLPGIGTARVYVFTNRWADAE
jgi:uncharacterized protein (DUF927 family)